MIMPRKKNRKKSLVWMEYYKYCLLSSLVVWVIWTLPKFQQFSSSSVVSSSSSSSPVQETKLTKNKNPDVNATPSLFNCESQYGKCRYFYPSQFLATDPETNSNGPGSDYYTIYERFMTLKEKGELWKNMPRVGSPTFSYNEERINPITGIPFCRHNVTFVHVHKAGGTTIMTSFKNRRTFHHMKRNPLYNSREWRPNMRLNDAYLRTVTKYKPTPEDWEASDHVLFAFMRDPISRFISSIGQAMGATGSSNNKIGKVLQRVCIPNPDYTPEKARHVIQCVLDYIQEHGYEIELHFTPQAIEMAFATQMHPVPVSVFQFEDSYKDVISEMGIDPERKERDGSKSGYRKQEVLTKMSVEDYTQDLKRQVCELYKVDVIMAHTLGWPFESCAEFISL